jgi:hypothetical protein
MDIFKELQEEQSKVEVDLGALTDLVHQLEFMEAPVLRDIQPLVEVAEGFSLAELEEVVKLRKQSLNQLKNESIPELMASYGIDRITTTDGTEVNIKDDFSVNLLVKDRPLFYEYLRSIGYGSLVKEQLVLTNYGEDEEAVLELIKDKADVQRKEDVHFQTMKKFVRTRMEFGEPIPEYLSVYPYKTTHLKRRK